MGILVLLLLAQAGSDAAKPQVPIAIVVSSRRDTGNTLSSALCAKLKEGLAARGITAMDEKQSADRLSKLGAVDSHACDGSKLCLAKLAELLQGIVVGVDIGKIQKFNAGHLEAVAVGHVESLAVSDFTSDAKQWPKKSADEVGLFLDQVAKVAVEMNKALQPVEPPPVKVAVVEPLPVDVPRQGQLLPEPPPPMPPSVLAETRKPRGPLPYVFLGATVVAAVVAAVLLGLASSDAQQFNGSLSSLQGGSSSRYTRAQLDDLSASGNLNYSASLGAGIGAGVFAVVTGFLFVREP